MFLNYHACDMFSYSPFCLLQSTAPVANRDTVDRGEKEERERERERERECVCVCIIVCKIVYVNTL